MTRFECLDPPGLYDPSPNGYSHVVSVAGGARMIFIAGQGGENAAGALAEGFAAQVKQAFANLVTALAAAESTISDVVKLTLLVVDHDEEKHHIVTASIDEHWGRSPRPTCTLVPVPRLALAGMLFEVDAVAAR